MSEERFSIVAAAARPHSSSARAGARLVVELGQPRARGVSPARLRRCGGPTAHNPVQMLQSITAARLAAAATDPEFLQAYDQAIFGLDEARTRAHPWWKEREPLIERRQHRVFLRRVRAAPVAADLRRRPRRAGRRSLQGSDRPRRAARRRRLHVSAGLLPPAHDATTAGRRSATSASAGTTRPSKRR